MSLTSFNVQGNIAFNLRGLVSSDPSADSFPVAITALTTPVGETIQFATVKMDWKETPEVHIIKVDVPGLKKGQVKVVAQEGRILLISGELIRDIKEENSCMWHRMERSSGKFYRRLKLPENARMDQIMATLEDGLLTVTVPKMEDRVIKISDDVQMDQNGELRGKSTADKGKAVVDVVKHVKGIKISGESSRGHKMENRVIVKISDDAQMEKNGVLRAKSTAEKGKAVVKGAKDVIKGIKISGEGSRRHEMENMVNQNSVLSGESTADKGKGKAVVEEAKDVVPETVPEETIKHVVGAVKLSGRKIKWE